MKKYKITFQVELRSTSSIIIERDDSWLAESDGGFRDLEDLDIEDLHLTGEESDSVTKQDSVLQLADWILELGEVAEVTDG